MKLSRTIGYFSTTAGLLAIFRLIVKDNDMALLDKSSQFYGVSLSIWDHTVLPATRLK